MPFLARWWVTDGIAGLANRFFATVGLVEPAGYLAIEALLDESVQPYFGGRGYLLLAFSPEAAYEHAHAELLTYGSPLLDVMAEVATARGNAIHFYLNSVQPTTGRTLEKVRAQIRLPGHLLETGEERLMMFHHALFRFKVSLTGEEREELFRDVVVDLHTGWATLQFDEQALRFYNAGERAVCPELRLGYGLRQAYQTATEKLGRSMVAQVNTHEEQIRRACRAEQRQVVEHYQAMIARLEGGKTRKGADPERIDAKVRATRTDQELRLKDLERRYRLIREITLTQMALVSYLKATVPLRMQQGKEVKPGVAIWDSLVREGYLAPLKQ
jgi:hypothetical protein